MTSHKALETMLLMYYTTLARVLLLCIYELGMLGEVRMKKFIFSFSPHNDCVRGRHLKCPPLPRRSKLRIACSDFFQKSERARSAAPPFKIEPTSLGFNFDLFEFISVNAARTLAPRRRKLCIACDGDFSFRTIVVPRSPRCSSFQDRNHRFRFRFYTPYC